MLAMHAPFGPTLLDAMMMEAVRPPRDLLHASHDVPRLGQRDDGSFALTVSAPGVSAKDLAITVEGNTLTIDGETKVGESHTHVVHWTTALPHDADLEHAKVSVIDGVVTVSAPRKPEAEPVSITVGTTPVEAKEAEEAEEAYTLTLAATGIAASDIEIKGKMAAGAPVLTVEGKTARTGARLAKRLRLTRGVDFSRASASHVDGLLTINLPKLAPVDAKKTKLAINGVEASDEDMVMEHDQEDFAVV